MRILVTESEFVWKAGDGQEFKAVVLRAPETCIFEPIEVYRDGAAFDTGAILFIGEEGYDGFEGFEAVFGERIRSKTLEPSMFKPGDEIDINLLRGNIPEPNYWAGMTATEVAAP